MRIHRLIVALTSLAVAALPQKAVFTPEPCGRTCSEIFDRGHLIHLWRPAHVEVHNPEGLRLFEAMALNPAGRSVGSTRSAAIDTDETVAVTAIWDAPRGYTGGVVLFDRQGNQTRIIETGRFMPTHVTFDPNHSIWVFGWQRNAEDWAIEDTQDYPLIRKFSKSGTEEGRLLSRSAFPGRPGAVELFRAAADRVGMLLAPPSGAGESRWLEIDFQGKLLGTWRIGERFPFRVAYTAQGRLYAVDFEAKTDRPRLAAFDRSSGRWMPSMKFDAGAENTFDRLLGSDGEQLVFSDTRRQKIVWMKSQ